MIPKAKMVARLRFPPTNRSYIPNRVPRWARKNSARTWVSMPAVGRCPPIR